MQYGLKEKKLGQQLGQHQPSLIDLTENDNEWHME